MRRRMHLLRARIRRVESEAGDTLIEVLIAIVVIGLGATALMAGFGATIVGSSEHRSLATIDTVLRSFAETAKFQVQQQVSPLYTNCATGYTLASVPTPSSGPPGTALTVFGTGFTPGNTMSVTLTDTSTHVASVLQSQYVNGGQPVVVPSPPALNAGDVTVTFSIPLSGFTVGESYAITLSDGTGPGSISASSTTPFTVATGTPVATSSLVGYSLVISQIQTWNPHASPPAFQVSPCAPSGIQLVTLSAIAPNKVTNAMSFAVIDPAFVVQAFTPTVTVSASPTGPTATSTVTFTATVAGPTNAAAPTGNLTWSLSGPGSPACSTSTLTPGSGNSSTATCTLPNAQASPPSYSATANYAGDAEYVAASGTANLTVQGLTSAISVAPSPPTPALGSTITFTATVTGPSGGPAPTGTLTWNLSGPGGPSCPNSALTVGSGNSSTAMCAVSNVLGGTYAVAPRYAGDGYYLSSSGSGSATVNPTAPSISVAPSPATPALGSTITFTATVTGPSGGPAPTGTLTWNLSGPGTPSCPISALTPGSGNSSTAMCAVANVSVGTYGATANYPGDGNYGVTSGTGTIAVSKATPTVNVVSSPTSPSPGSNITFTATVAGPSAAPAPTGTLTWSLSGPGSPSCPTSALIPGSGNSSTATCAVSNVSVGTYTVTPNYGGNGNYTSVSGSGSVVVASPPLNVTSVASANHGSTAGTLEVGDTFSVTFSNALDPSTINQTAGATTITLDGNGGSTNIMISGLSVPAGFTVGSVYESSGKSATANGTLSLSNGNTTVTFTVTGGSLGASNHVQQGAPVTFTFVPNSSIKDTNGTQPNPSGYVQGTAILLF